MTATEPRAPTPRRLRSRLLSSLLAVPMVLILALPLSATSAGAQTPQQGNTAEMTSVYHCTSLHDCPRHHQCTWMHGCSRSHHEDGTRDHHEDRAIPFSLQR